MGELRYAQTSGSTRIFFYVQTFISNWSNAEEYFDSATPLAWPEGELLRWTVPPPCYEHLVDIYRNWIIEITWQKECLALVSFPLYAFYFRNKVLGDQTIDIELIWPNKEMSDGNEEKEEKGYWYRGK